MFVVSFGLCLNLLQQIIDGYRQYTSVLMWKESSWSKTVGTEAAIKHSW